MRMSLFCQTIKSTIITQIMAQHQGWLAGLLGHAEVNAETGRKFLEAIVNRII